MTTETVFLGVAIGQTFTDTVFVFYFLCPRLQSRTEVLSEARSKMRQKRGGKRKRRKERRRKIF